MKDRKEMRGKEIWHQIKSPFGMFFCEAHICDLPLSQRSQKDIRYCNFCQPIIEEEYIQLAERKGRPLDNFYRSINPEMLSTIPRQGGQIMHTLRGSKNRVCIIKPSVGKRGPKKIELPEEEIKEMSRMGIGSKIIARRLKAEFDIDVSYSTIQRFLKGG